MRKLTAGIFTLLLGLVSVGTAKAAVVSTEYLNDKLELELKDMQVASNMVLSENATDTTTQAADDKYLSAKATYAAIDNQLTAVSNGLQLSVNALDQRVGDAEGEIKVLNGNGEGSISKLKTDLQANIDLKADQTALDATNVKVAANETAIAAEKTARESADNALQANIDLKANIADVYSKDAADKLFEAQTAATQKLTDAKAYTDNQIKKLTEDLGSVGPGEDGTGGTGLQGTVAGHGVRIGALEDKVGDTSVVDRIAALKNVDEPVAKEFVKSVSQENGVITVTRAALVASDIPVIAISQVDGLQAALDAKQVKLTSADGVIVIDASGNISIASKSIGTGMIADSAVTTEKINDGAVTSDKLGANAVTAGKIAADAVTEGTIADGAVVAGNLAAGAVEAGNLAQNAVTAGTIAAGAVTNATINDGELSVAKIKDLSTTLEKKFEVPAYETRTEDGMYVLTATQKGDQVTYAWENIAGR